MNEGEMIMQYDVIIIGAGPAGYVAAIRAAQLGMKTALIDREHIGGMCLNWGCIPTKALIESAKFYQKMKRASEFGIDGVKPASLKFNWEAAAKRAQGIVHRLTAGVAYLLKKNDVDVIIADAAVEGPGKVMAGKKLLKAKSIIIATGSLPAPLTGFENAPVSGLRELLTRKSVPDDILILGKGALAVEMAQLFHMTGSAATLLTDDENIIPSADHYINTFVKKKFKRDGINTFFYGENTPRYVDGSVEWGKERMKFSEILNCSTRKAVVPVNQGIQLDENGFILTDWKFETSLPGVYAIGDVNGKSYLAHVASAQGIWLVNLLKGIRQEFDITRYPLNIYTAPEMAQVGLTEQDLLAEGIEYKLSEFPLSANGKALAEGNAEGLIRMLSDKKYGQVLGVQIIAENATDLIAEATAYLQIEGTIYDVAQTVHAHPTVSEIFMEAGFDAIDKAIHK